jgi:hypothetical protein
MPIFKIYLMPSLKFEFRSSKELRKEFIRSEALKKKCCLKFPLYGNKFIYFSGTKNKFSSYFAEQVLAPVPMHIGITFLTLRKVKEKIYFSACLPTCPPKQMGRRKL